MFWRIWFSFVIGTILCSVGGWALYYAHEHEPTPQADPMAVRLLSPEAYARWHWAGIALVALGALGFCWMLALIHRS